jgi:cyclophilin family peptidyl-prolyl cis-trans isomerase
MGEYDVELFDASAAGVTPRAGDTARTTPLHVDNFIQYIDSTDPARNYTDTIVHRNGKSGGQPFVIQGGGFKVDPGDFPTALNEFATVTNEPGNSNIRGTLACRAAAASTAAAASGS